MTLEIDKLYLDLEKAKLHPKLIEVLDITVYHGTSPVNAQAIIRERYMMETAENNGLLGRGAYFYENEPAKGPLAAQAWAKHIKRYPSQAVVAAAVRANKIWDLTNPQNRRYFQAVFDWVAEAASKSRPEVLGRVTVPKVAKFILSTCPERNLIQGVRWNGFRIDEIGINGQFGLAIRDSGCIKKMWLHDERASL